MRKYFKFIYKLIPAHFRSKIEIFHCQFTNFRILARNYGQFRTIKDWNCLDSSGRPIPWYTYPAIEYLNHLDFSDLNVFEYGSGILHYIGRKRLKM